MKTKETKTPPEIKPEAKPKKVYPKRPRLAHQLTVEEVVFDEKGRPDTSLLTQVQMRMLSKFRASHGVVSRACMAAGVSRDTFYRWQTENKIFAHLIDRAKQENNDYVENKLWDRLERGEPWAIQMYMRANHPSYSDKLQVNVKQLTPSWYNKRQEAIGKPIIRPVEKEIPKVSLQAMRRLEEKLDRINKKPDPDSLDGIITDGTAEPTSA